MPAKGPSRVIRTIIAATLPLALAACGKAATESDNPLPSEPASAPGAQADAQASTAAAGETPAAFLQCKTCHAVEPGRHGIGPSLAGVHGRKAGAAAGYNYSTAMKASGLTWDDAALDRYLEGPVKTVPGTKMAYPGLKDPAKRAELITYLKTL